MLSRLVRAGGVAALATLFLACGDDTSSSGGAGGASSGAGNPGGAGSGAGSTGGSGGGVGAMGPGFSCDATSEAFPALKVTEIASGLDAPVQAKSAPGQPDRLYVVEQSGAIRVLENGQLAAAPWLDVSGIISYGGELGLLGLAFHPGFATNGRFFIHYSDGSNQDSVVAEYKDGDPPTLVGEVFRHGTDEENHNGGAVEFGSDGYLYISLGDGGAQGDPGCDAQNPATLLGKISRVDVDAAGYPAAPGNPDGAKYFHVGLRNPWRISFDACTGDLYVGDVGQNEWEEIDIAPAAAGPLNFGWPMREGLHAYPGDCATAPANPVDPIAEYAHFASTATCGNAAGSVSGGYVYRGSSVPALRGTYFYGDFCTGTIWRLKVENGAVVTPATDAGITVDALSAFGQDGNGEVYAISLFGSIFKIEAQ